MTGPTIVWIRDDLRLSDNPALHAAAERGEKTLVVYLLDEETEGIRSLGGAARWWLHHSLIEFARELDAIGGTLVLRRGSAAVEIPGLVHETGASLVLWNRRYGSGRIADAALKSSLREEGVEVASFQANLLHEPWTVTTGQGTGFRVFTPFYRACLAMGEPRHPLSAPDALASPEAPASDRLEDWGLLPTGPDWAGGLRESWIPGERAASDDLDAFIADTLDDYGEHRDEPGVEATSRLSARLRWGELSPFEIWRRVTDGAVSPTAKKNAAAFLRQIVWREFNWSILYNQPDLATRNFRPEFDAFPWEEPEPPVLEAWQRGRTGIPLVDAGMRELWHTGVMHNRVRLVTASFLVKNLLLDWRLGEQWFWDTLVDADEANNPANWQWVAGSGADAAPYFRIFNPLLQGDKFDPAGEYQRRWIPELGSAEYPEPIVDLKQSRQDALDAYAVVKQGVDRR